MRAASYLLLHLRGEGVQLGLFLGEDPGLLLLVLVGELVSQLSHTLVPLLLHLPPLLSLHLLYLPLQRHYPLLRLTAATTKRERRLKSTIERERLKSTIERERRLKSTIERERLKSTIERERLKSTIEWERLFRPEWNAFFQQKSDIIKIIKI